MKWLTNTWYQPHPLNKVLLPLAWLYQGVSRIRKWAYQRGWFTRTALSVPVIVVGNISVGGTGKTPFVIWLVEQLKEAGYKPGIISRGYGAQPPSTPYIVTPESPVKEAGDEPKLLALRTQCPVVIDPKRARAGQHLLEQFDCDVIVTDDGLQHYALHRHIEIAIVDADRRFGNGLCLPAGPLREPVSRLKQVDYVVFNGTGDSDQIIMTLSGKHWVNLAENTVTLPIAAFSQQTVHAIAGIGYPQRFFDTLSAHSITPHAHPFSDHYRYVPDDLAFDDDLPILMTEKDAVKCRSFASDKCWYLPVSANINGDLATDIMRQLKDMNNG